LCSASAAVAAGGAVITGIIASSDYNNAEHLQSDLHATPICQRAHARAHEHHPDGVAIVGVGVGVTLLLTSGPDLHKPASLRAYI